MDEGSSITSFNTESDGEFNYTQQNPNISELSSSDDEESPDSGKERKKIFVKNLSLPTFCAALDRANVSNRFGSLLATTLLKDLNIPDIVIDQHKIRRERNKAREKSLKNVQSNSLLQGVSFDGKRDQTLKQIVVNGSPRNVKIMEEHMTIVKEPNSSYVGYITPEDGKGSSVGTGVLDFLKEEQYSLEHLVAVNWDGTRANTGKNNGAICVMEKHLQRPLQWFVCLFHFNELPFTAVLKSMLGKASGPQSWPGIIGHTLNDCEILPVVPNYEPIRMGKMPQNISGWDLRADQKYLYDIVRAVDSGSCDARLESIKPGPLNLSRWLTTAARILRLYVTESKPSEILKNIALFVMKVYAPFWFLIKSKPQAIHGSRHLLKYIQLIRELPPEMREVVCHSVQINGFFAHPENIILSMITDIKKEIRIEGYDLLFKARDNVCQNLRQFNIPRILFHSESLKDMINWSHIEHVTEPPCIQFLPNQYLNKFRYSDEIIQIPDFPCHSQNTEKFVKVVSQSCLSVIDKNRSGHIANKIESCKLYTKIDSRKDLM